MWATTLESDCEGRASNAAVIPRDVKDGRSDWCSTETNQRRKPETKTPRAQAQPGIQCAVRTRHVRRAAKLGQCVREGKMVAKPRKPTSFGLVQATRERHLLCPSADAFHSNAERRLALRGTWHAAEQETAHPSNQATGRPSGKPTAMSVKTVQNLRQRSDAAMASVPTSLWNPFPKARQVSIRCERRWARQRELKAQARLATERRARQTGRCPAYSENRLCRGKPHGRRQGGKDLASDRGRCATLQNSAEHATPQGAG